MHKTVLAATIALLTLLALTGAALAASPPSHRNPDGSPPGDEARSPATQPRAHYRPLGAALAGAAVVNGHVYHYDGSVEDGAYVYWEAPGTDGYVSDWTYADADGFYSFSGLPAADAAGYLKFDNVSYPRWYISKSNLTWADPGPTTFDFRPGAVPTSITRGGVWSDWTQVWSHLYGSDGTSWLTATSEIEGTDSVVTADSYAAPGIHDWGALYFWMDQGIEYDPSATVTAGAQSAQSISVSQLDAQRISVTTPYWGSGKPGTVAKIRHWNYPAGWRLGYYGYANSPSGKPYKNYTGLTTTGADPFMKSLTIPATAPAGYWYMLETYNKDGPLDLETPFQVCTLKSTKAAVRKGGSIKLSGVIPTQGHWGSQAGMSKYVTIYKRTKSVSAAPTAWDATQKGWTKVARVKANGFGKYASAYLRPSRTTWYVVRYPGDDWYWGAYTSVLKVRVY